MNTLIGKRMQTTQSMKEKRKLCWLSLRKRRNQIKKHGSWILSSHMCSHKEWFLKLNEQIRVSVKLGNGKKLVNEGKGSVKPEVDAITQIVTEIYYVHSRVE